MAEHPRPGECIYAGDGYWRIFLTYQDGQYHMVNVCRREDWVCTTYEWVVDSELSRYASEASRPRLTPGRPSSIYLEYSPAPPALLWDENGAVTADIDQLEALHLRPDVLDEHWTVGPGGMRYLGTTHITWDERSGKDLGHKVFRFHRVGYPAIIGGTNLIKLADLTVSECGPAPSKDGTPVYVSSVGYHLHGLEHRDEGPYYTKGVCTCSTGRCERLRVWRQHGELRIDRPYRVTCDRQVWVPRDYRPATVHRDGRLDWPSPTPERYTFWSHADYAQPVRLRFRAIAAATTVSGLANLITWWVAE
jgi:hypothetical protein